MIERLGVDFDDHHAALESVVRECARDRIEPIESEGGTEDVQARRFLAVLRDSDLLRWSIPEGSGSAASPRRHDCRAICIVRENLARASGFADVMFAMQGLGAAPIALAGTPEQRGYWLPRVATGEAIAAFALTEPDAGSDVAAMTTTATKTADGYQLDGVKCLISNAGVADFYTVFAKTDRAAGHRGISAFAVPANTSGLVVTQRQQLIAPHPIGTLQFKNCRVPASARLGAEGDGFKIAMATLDVFRPTVGAAALGLARRALAESIERAKTRRGFGQPIGAFQLVQAHLAAMATDVDAASLLVYRAANTLDRTGAADTRQSSEAKWFATEAAQRVIDRAVQIFGGQGVLVGSVVERLYREVRALRIYEGTSEIQQVVIATRLLKDESPGY